MAATRKRLSVAIDTVPLPQDVLKMSVKRGKVTKAGAKHFLTIGARKLEIPTGVTITAAEVNKLVGKDVYAAFSNKRGSEIVGIGTWPKVEKPPRVTCYWILCYIPAPDMLKRIDLIIRQELRRNMVAQGIITPQLDQRIEEVAGR